MDGSAVCHIALERKRQREREGAKMGQCFPERESAFVFCFVFLGGLSEGECYAQGFCGEIRNHGQYVKVITGV